MGNKSDLIEYSVRYPCTNESISAVVCGLDLKPSDVVISIAGSGDIPFAIAPHVKKIYAVDWDDAQVKFMEEQMNFLKKGYFRDFYGEDFFNSLEGFDVSFEDMVRRKNYFSEKRLSKVLDSLDKIKIISGSVSNVIDDSSSFSKLYLSNSRVDYYFEKLDNLAKGGVVYSSNSYFKCNDNSIVIDNIRTNFARDDEGRFNPSMKWVPTVYRKIK